VPSAAYGTLEAIFFFFFLIFIILKKNQERFGMSACTHGSYVFAGGMEGGDLG
jgi:hypothetical protein